MPSIRLTNEIREEITAAMLRHRFAKELAKIVKMRAKLADRIYRDLYSTAERKQIDALPEGWLPTALEIRFSAAGKYERLTFSGSFYGEMNKALDARPEATFRRIASKHRVACVKAYDGQHPIAEAHSEMENDLKDVSARFTTAKRQIEAALSKAGTTKRLVELWPEAAPFCAPYEKDAPQLPSIPTGDLNKLLDLPAAA